MHKPDWITSAAEVISAIGTNAFPATLASLLRAVTPYTYTVMFGYRGAAQPLGLYDDFPAAKRKIFVTDYQEGPYLLDPFFLAAMQPVVSGLYRMRDLAPDRFYQGEYFRNYYVQTGLAEEIGIFVALPDAAIVVVSLMRKEKSFSPRELRDLEKIRPVIDASIRHHWGDLALSFGRDEDDTDTTRLHRQIEHSFQTFGGGLLTPRERQIVEYTLKGHSSDATGRILAISPGTVRIHRRNIYAKLHIRSQGELFSRFILALGGRSDF
ncbi:MAG: LuxR C-terminal-related transcriptional regulator [Pseudorhodobacter sp.]|nr:LuxR C-terminal-related transcriptional regulator [Pseudorhodobacter sp.]